MKNQPKFVGEINQRTIQFEQKEISVFRDSYFLSSSPNLLLAVIE